MRRTRSVKILDELNRIFDQLQVKEDTQFIWGGDFNVVFDTVLDAHGGSPKLKLKSVSKLLSVMSENDLIEFAIQIRCALLGVEKLLFLAEKARSVSNL